MHPLTPLSLLASAVLCGASASQVTPPQLERAFTTFGSSIGNDGFTPSTQPGLNETYVTSYEGGHIWYALQYDATAQTYIQTFSSPLMPNTIASFALLNLLGGPEDEILVVLGTGNVFVYNQTTKAQLLEFSTGVTQMTAFDHRDIDGDGRDEFAMLGNHGLYIFDSDGTQILHDPTIDGRDLVIGQMDTDPSFEIATTDGQVLDIDSGLVQCNRSIGFGIDLDLYDFDGDGMEELVFAQVFNSVRAYDVDTCQIKWSLPAASPSVIAIGDSNQDGIFEVIIGEEGADEILSYDLDTQTLNWVIDNEGKRVINGISLFDIDGDGETEVIWGTGKNNAGPNHMRVGDVGLQSVEWESLDLTGPFVGPVAGDIDGDGIDELLTASKESNSGSGAGMIVALQEHTLLPLISPPVFNNASNSRVHNIALHDVDGDGDEEIMIAGVSMEGRLEIYDYSTSNGFTLIWNSPWVSGAYFCDIDAADIDLDGELEIIATTAKDNSGTAGNKVYVFDYATGVEEWNSIVLSMDYNKNSKLSIADFDQDGQPEIAVFDEFGDAYIFAGDSTLEATITGNFTCIQSAPIPTGTGTTLLLGDKNGLLQAFIWNGSGYDLMAAAPFSPKELHGVTLGKDNQLFVGSKGFLTVYSLPTGTPLWKSQEFNYGFGETLAIWGDSFASAEYNGIYVFGPY